MKFSVIFYCLVWKGIRIQEFNEKKTADLAKIMTSQV